MQLIETYNGHADENHYDVVVRFKLGGIEHDAYVSLLRKSDVVNFIEIRESADDGRGAEVTVPTALKKQLLETALAFKSNSQTRLPN